MVRMTVNKIHESPKETFYILTHINWILSFTQEKTSYLVNLFMQKKIDSINLSQEDILVIFWGFRWYIKDINLRYTWDISLTPFCRLQHVICVVVAYSF